MNVTFTLPLPPRELHPNARVHHRPKAECTRKARSDAMYEAMYLMETESLIGGWNAALVNVQCVFPDRRRRDLDGVFSACKAYFDGIVDSGLLVDDAGLTFVLPPAKVDKANAGVVLTITPITEGVPE